MFLNTPLVRALEERSGFGKIFVQPAAGNATDLSAPLHRIVRTVKKRSLLVLISDLLAPVDELERHLSRLTAAGHEMVVFQVLDGLQTVRGEHRRVIGFLQHRSHQSGKEN